MPAPKGNQYALNNNGGPPSKFDPDFHKDAIFNLMLTGATFQEMAKAFSITRQTLFNWLKSDKELFDMAKSAKYLADSAIVGAAYRKALEGDSRAQQFWLMNRQRDKWNAKENDSQQGIQVIINRNNTEITKDNQTLTIEHD